MPAVLPPEWDAMSAKEQLLWYLERLCAKAEEMSSVLGIARVGDPPVVPSLVDPAASTTTHASSMTVPDVSCSNTKAQEVLEVIHDAPPTYIARAPVTCSTDGSTQVVAVANVDEVHDATTTVRPEPVVDLNDKEVEQATTARATSSICTCAPSITEEVVPPVAPTPTVTPTASSATVHIFHELLGSAMSAESLDVDTTFVAALTLTNCSTGGLDHSTGGDHLGTGPPTPWIVTPAVAAPPGLTPTPLCQLFAALELGTGTTTKCSTHCFNDNPSEGDKMVPLTYFLCARSHGGGCWKRPWPPPQVISMMGVYYTELIFLEKPFSCLSVAQLQSRRPPDHQPKMKSEVQRCLPPTQLQVLMLAFVELQPWPSWNFSLTFLPILRGLSRFIAGATTFARSKSTDFACWEYLFSIFADIPHARSLYACAVVQILSLLVLVLSPTQPTVNHDNTSSQQLISTERFNPLFHYLVVGSVPTYLQCFGDPYHPLDWISTSALHGRMVTWYLDFVELGTQCVLTTIPSYVYYLDDGHLAAYLKSCIACTSRNDSQGHSLIQFAKLGDAAIESEVFGSYVFPVSSIEQQPWTSVQLAFLVSTEPSDWGIAIQRTIQIMPMSMHWNISWQKEFKRSGRTAISLHIGSAWGRCSNLLENCIRILRGQLWCLWSLRQYNEDFCFTKQPLHEGKQWLSTLCECSITTALALQYSYLATMDAHLFQSMQRMGALSTESSSIIFLQSMQLGPYALVCCVISSVQSSYELYEHRVLERAAVCHISGCDKLQGANQIMSMLVIWNFLSEEEFKGSGRVEKLRFRSNLLVCETAGSAKGLTGLKSGDVWSNSLVSYVAIRVFGELPELDVYRARPYELMLYLDQKMDISNTQLADYKSWCYLKWLSSDYLLIDVVDMLESDLRLYQLGMSWDPGGLALLLLRKLTRWKVFQGGRCAMILVARCLVTFLASTLQSSTIMMAEVISKRAHAMGGIVPSTCSDQEHSQGGRGVIAVAVRFAQGSVDHKYYIDFNNDYFLDNSFGLVAIVHDYYSHVVKVISAFGCHRDFELVKDHRVQWDLGGSRWRWLGVKPDFKEGGMLGALLTCTRTGAAPWASPWTWPVRDHRCSYLSQAHGRRGYPEDHGTERQRRLPFFYLCPQFLVPLVMATSVTIVCMK